MWIGAQERALSRIHNIGSQRLPPHLLTGLRGEQAALFELRRRGMVIVARRWSSPRLRGDVDLIGWQAGTLCFVEVKTRTARDLNPAESEVDDDKRSMLRALAHAYLRSFPAAERTNIPIRFDVISVYLTGAAPEFDYFPGAFGRQ
jgi:putative endonuclease